MAGAPLHVAAHLRACGWDSTLITRIGQDDDGRSVLATMQELGLDTSCVEEDSELPTGRVTVGLDDGEHRFEVLAPAAWDRLEAARTMPEHQAFCYGTLAGRSPRSRESLRRLLGEACDFKVMDVNLRPPHVVPEVLRMGLDSARLVKLNETEFSDVAAAVGFAATIDAYFETAPNLRWICMTRGPAGAELHRRDGNSWGVEGARVEVLDTVGAGDAFTAGLIDGFGRGGGELHALERAQGLAVRTVGRRGGLPQTRER